ncbi:MAG: hypothetical protein HOE45_11545 [Gammaproteobacteria bacterium]|jgi:hypothetical protein|nr:hypothetical protein [Gammaproteobacteria bacterium]MBT4147485.1 hypothetical protein [Gammaproteobacteria bacterium]MBT5223527.1 hypothetical protein [Gammaproteobacteria bacterium]MBT5826635.1 hypothetical protein [Gammaproteobacteria bacterium]MBT5965917.1 hypothetical protein [Gammaproteobacteria bacterium]
MTKQIQKNHRTIIILALMTLVPFSFAWYLTTDPGFNPAATNNGDLVIPVITTERSDLQGVDEFSVNNIEQLKGHWVMLNIIPTGLCNKTCVEAIHATRQVRLMLNKDLTRTRRAVIIMQGKQESGFQPWWNEDDRLIKVKPAPALAMKIRQQLGGPITEGSLLLMDPLGNIMMQYPAGFDPYAVKGDLKKLLRISQIG